MKNKKILPPSYLYLSIVVVLVVHFLFPVATLITTPWRFLGIVPLALGLAINVVADGAFKKHETTVKPFKESTTLLINGVFQVSRNPMYLGFVLILVGITVFLGSLSPYIIIVLFAVLMDRVFIRAEEEILEETFGETWLAYKAQVRRWI